VRLARERSELRIVVDQVGAPTSSRSVAEGLISLLARDDGNSSSQGFAAADGLFTCRPQARPAGMGSHVRLSTDFEAGVFNLPPPALQRSRPGSFLQRLGHTNSRLDMGRLEKVLAINMPYWRVALDLELDELGRSV
jgi:dTDP-4-dehydrorhamnose reductase